MGKQWLSRKDSRATQSSRPKKTPELLEIDDLRTGPSLEMAGRLVHRLVLIQYRKPLPQRQALLIEQLQQRDPQSILRR